VALRQETRDTRPQEVAQPVGTGAAPEEKATEPDRQHEQMTPAPEKQADALSQETAHEQTRVSGKSAAAIRAYAEPRPARVPAVHPTPAPAPVPDREYLETSVSPEKISRLSSFAANNDEKLLKIYVGMSREQTEKIMGIVQHAGIFSNPYKEDTVRGAAGQVYKVLFYVTREPAHGRPLSNRHLTPVIIKDDSVYAIGRYQLKKLIRTRGQSASHPKPIEIVIKSPSAQ
jgi:hypothetical protein